MWISLKIQFKLSHVIFPKIVYNYTCTLILHEVKLQKHKYVTGKSEKGNSVTMDLESE